MTPLAITAIVAGAAVGYLLAAGTTWTVWGRNFREETIRTEPDCVLAEIATVMWPCTWAIGLGLAALAVPFLVGRYLFLFPGAVSTWRSNRNGLPKAQVRK
jgi:hypothetical protein